MLISSRPVFFKVPCYEADSLLLTMSGEGRVFFVFLCRIEEGQRVRRIVMWESDIVTLSLLKSLSL